jgi:tRNA-dihydrouridine synthase
MQTAPLLASDPPSAVSGRLAAPGRAAAASADWAFCVAPMMDWTDTHCRSFHRLLSRRARLYTEMVTTGAVLHGDLERLLGFDPSEHPVAASTARSPARRGSASASATTRST